MSQLTPILSVPHSTESTATWTIERLGECGFRVERTFDLHAARMAHAECPCPQHGTVDCTCQMVVLLVHAGGQQPVTVIVHGNDGQTDLSFVDLGNRSVESKVIQVLTALSRVAKF